MLGQLYQNQYSIEQIFDQLILRNPKECYKRLQKRVQRHKGYRDKGSLGTDYSRTLKDQSTDWSIREKILQKEKDREDLLDLLLGLQGWI